MNRTGLFIALALALVIGLLFGIYPELDLKLAALFYDAATKSFPLKLNALAAFARDAAMWIAWAFALPAIAALVVKLVRPDRPMLVSGRAVDLPAGDAAALRRRPHQSHLQELLGPAAAGGGDASSTAPQKFVPWWDPRGTCGRNCSFFSGEGATAFWTYAPAALTPPAWRPLAYAAATLFGIVTSGLRMAFGGHFFTDVAAAGLVTLPGDLAGLWLDLPLAVDPAVRRADRGRAGAAGLAGYRLTALAQARVRRHVSSRLSPDPSRFDSTPAAIKRVPSGAKFDIRALKPQTTSAISTDWKLHEYDPEKPAQRGKSRYRFLGRSRHQSRRCCG